MKNSNKNTTRPAGLFIRQEPNYNFLLIFKSVLGVVIKIEIMFFNVLKIEN